MHMYRRGDCSEVNYLNFMYVPLELRMTVIFVASIAWYLGATYVTHGSAHER